MIQQNRMRSVSEVRAALRDCIDDAADGRITHIMRDAKVVAHLVPADALILDSETRLVDLIVESLSRRTIAAVASDDADAPVQQSELATLLTFLRGNPRSYRRALTLFASVLGLHLGPRAELTVDVVLDWLGRHHSGQSLLGPATELTEVVRQAVDSAPEMIELLQSREREREFNARRRIPSPS